MFVPGRVRTPLSEDAYQARMLDLHCGERKGRRVHCHICSKELAVGSLAGHLASQHDTYQCFLAPGATNEGQKSAKLYRPFHTPTRAPSGALYPGAHKDRKVRGAVPPSTCDDIFHSATPSTRWWYEVNAHPSDTAADFRFGRPARRGTLPASYARI